MKKIIEILKGIIIGVANIIPGVSGGTLAVSMGIYEEIIGSITNLFKNFKKSIKTLLPYGIGMILGISVFSFVITYLFDNFPMQTNFMFIGLILGGVPLIYAGIKNHKIDLLHVLLFLIFASIVVLMGISNSNNASSVTIQLGFIEVIKLIVIGVIAAGTMVIPGVSGSMMLTLMGYYQPITNAIKELIKAIPALNLDVIINNVGILLPFGIGIVIGIIVIAKLIEFLLKKCPSYVFASILGLIIASPIAILTNVSFTNIEIPVIMVSVICLVVGILISLKLGKEE